MVRLIFAEARSHCIHAAVLALFLVLVCPGPSSAHDLARTETRLEVRGTELTAQHDINLLEFRGADTNGDGVIAQEELDEEMPRLFSIFEKRVRIGAPAPPVLSEVDSYDLTDGHMLHLKVRSVYAQPIEKLQITSELWRQTRPDSLHFVAVLAHDKAQQAVLNARAESADFDIRNGSPITSISRFVWLGLEHVLGGLDHLAFLLMLVLGARTMRSLAVLATAFTIAHSITLGLAAFNIVAPPARIIESGIAVTIMLVALENLFRREFPPRYPAAFVFGLIHGFGFSTVLREMALPKSDLVVSLLSFNVGIELGQLAFVSIAWVLLSRLKSKSRTPVVIALSSVVLLVAGYWFAQRAFL